jgi:hypothetical protein
VRLTSEQLDVILVADSVARLVGRLVEGRNALLRAAQHDALRLGAKLVVVAVRGVADVLAVRLELGLLLALFVLVLVLVLVKIVVLVVVVLVVVAELAFGCGDGHDLLLRRRRSGALLLGRHRGELGLVVAEAVGVDLLRRRRLLVVGVVVVVVKRRRARLLHGLLLLADFVVGVVVRVAVAAAPEFRHCASVRQWSVESNPEQNQVKLGFAFLLCKTNKQTLSAVATMNPTTTSTPPPPPPPSSGAPDSVAHHAATATPSGAPATGETERRGSRPLHEPTELTN